MSEVFTVYPQLKLKVYVDDINLHIWVKNQEVLQAAESGKYAQTRCPRGKVDVFF